MDLYIYYRVAPSQATTLFGKLKAMQAVLQADQGISARLKRRPEEKDGLQTWMEVYEGIAPGQEIEFSAKLDKALSAAGIAGLIEGSRHVEHFEDVAVCA